MPSCRIQGIRAEAGDRVALEGVLACTPNATEIRQFVRSAHTDKAPEHRAFYDSRSGTASYITIWHGRVVCLLALAVSEPQARAIDGKMEVFGVTAWLSLAVFQDAVESALDKSVHTEHPKGVYLTRWLQPRSP